MLRTNSKGFTLVELMIVITVILFLMSLVLAIRGPVMNQLNDMGCQKNLKAFDTALGLYRNEYSQQLPDVSGIKFVAILYRCGYLTEKAYYLCPARQDGLWVEQGTDKTTFKFQKPAQGEAFSQPWDPRFQPWEINYAGRKNELSDTNPFRLTGANTDPTPLISDATTGRDFTSDAKYAPHNGAVNVLLTNGSIMKLKGMAVGQKPLNPGDMDLESLQND